MKALVLLPPEQKKRPISASERTAICPTDPILAKTLSIRESLIAICQATKTPMATIASNRTESIGEISEALTKACRTVNICSGDDALNGIQVSVMTRKIINRQEFSDTNGGNLTCRSDLSTARYKPCKPPQRTNDHDAPCHKPPINIVAKRAKYVRTRPWRLPPSGM